MASKNPYLRPGKGFHNRKEIALLTSLEATEDPQRCRHRRAHRAADIKRATEAELARHLFNRIGRNDRIMRCDDIRRSETVANDRIAGLLPPMACHAQYLVLPPRGRVYGCSLFVLIANGTLTHSLLASIVFLPVLIRHLSYL